VARQNLAALDIATGAATAWNPGADGSVLVLAPSGSSILVGGAFTVIGGQSRGGILSVAYAGAHPQQVRGVINFVGGWTGDSCIGDFNGTAFAKAASAKIPTL